MAGRRLAGIGQLLLAVAGFVMVLGWFVLFAFQMYEQLVNDAEPKSVASGGRSGRLDSSSPPGSGRSSPASASCAKRGPTNRKSADAPRHHFLVLGRCVLLAAGALAETPRFVIDDEEYVDKVTEASARLLQDGKLKSLDSLRGQVRSGGFSVKPVPLAHQKLEAPELCDRLRQSTLAVGSYYKCPDCGEWHFNSSAGFVVGEGGVICTCCHVVQAEDEGRQRELPHRRRRCRPGLSRSIGAGGGYRVRHLLREDRRPRAEAAAAARRRPRRGAGLLPKPSRRLLLHVHPGHGGAREPQAQ